MTKQNKKPKQSSGLERMIEDTNKSIFREWLIDVLFVISCLAVIVYVVCRLFTMFIG